MSDEVYSFLESIPEWKDYFENDLAKQNAIEAKPLGADPRKGHCSDDFIDLMFKMNKPDDTTNQENDDELESIEDDEQISPTFKIQEQAVESEYHSQFFWKVELQQA